MGRVQCYCFALVVLCALAIGVNTSTHIDHAKSHKRQLAENANVECLRAFRSSVVDNGGYLEKQWNLEKSTTSQGTVCNMAGVACSKSTHLLVGLDLANAGLSGAFPTGLSKCSSLTSVTLSYNNFSGPLPSDLCQQLPFLVVLDMSWNFFTGDVNLLNCSFLAKLHLFGNQLSGEIALSNCTTLTTLDLSHNQFSQEIVLSNCTSLAEMDLSYNNFSGEIPSAISHCPLLRKLSLRNNLWNGSIPRDLGLLPHLTFLDLSHNALSGPIPSSLLDNPRLSHLDFTSNARLCGPAKLMSKDMHDDWECLTAFKSSVVDMGDHLASWNFSCMFPGIICSFAGVECWKNDQVSGITLAQSGLTGSFPLGLSKCKWLQSLSLPQNQFTGPLPAGLCKQMPSLRDLDLSHNEFTGNIPTALGDCKALSTLHLQNNLLSGGIPLALGVLPSLSTLNLSSNALSGSIPSSLIKPSFSASTFANNPHLCGPPLPSRCASKRSALHKRSPLHKLAIAGGAIFAIAFVLIFCRLRRHACRGSRESAVAWVEMFDKQLRVTWEDLQRATSGFSQANLIGRGGSSKVYKGKLLNGRMVAVKVFIRAHEPEQEMESNTRKKFLTELEVLGKLRHRNLVRILSYCYNLDTMAIVLDFMPLGSLNALLHSDTPCHGSLRSRQSNHLQRLNMDLKVRVGILKDIAEGLVYLHHEYDGKRYVIHGDLKPSNVLLDEHMVAHIADFGLARMVGNINTGSIATPLRQIVSGAHWCSYGYTAPEVAQQGVVSRKADIFSFGVTMLEVITGERPDSFRLEEDQTLADWVRKAVEKGAPDSVVSRLLKEIDWKQSSDDITTLLRLGCACASHVPAARPAMYQVLTFLRYLVNKDPVTKQSLTHAPHPVDHNEESELWILS